jgi:hypothetical protein
MKSPTMEGGSKRLAAGPHSSWTVRAAAARQLPDATALQPGTLGVWVRLDRACRQCTRPTRSRKPARPAGEKGKWAASEMMDGELHKNYGGFWHFTFHGLPLFSESGCCHESHSLAARGLLDTPFQPLLGGRTLLVCVSVDLRFLFTEEEWC